MHRRIRLNHLNTVLTIGIFEYFILKKLHFISESLTRYAPYSGVFFSFFHTFSAKSMKDFYTKPKPELQSER